MKWSLLDTNTDPRDSGLPHKFSAADHTSHEMSGGNDVMMMSSLHAWPSSPLLDVKERWWLLLLLMDECEDINPFATIAKQNISNSSQNIFYFTWCGESAVMSCESAGTSRRFTPRVVWRLGVVNVSRLILCLLSQNSGILRRQTTSGLCHKSELLKKKSEDVNHLRELSWSARVACKLRWMSWSLNQQSMQLTINRIWCHKWESSFWDICAESSKWLRHGTEDPIFWLWVHNFKLYHRYGPGKSQTTVGNSYVSLVHFANRH